MSSLLTTQLLSEFDENGYVVIPGLIDIDELDRYAHLVRQAVHRRKAKDQRKLEEKSAYEQSFMQCMNLWEDFPQIRPLTFHPNICQAAAELLGVGKVRLWHDQALFKEPGGRMTDPHQDHPYWPMEETASVTAWIPFHDIQHETGCMGYIPGSHKLGIRKFVNIFNANTETGVGNQADELMSAAPNFITVPKGSIAFHHGLTAHRAKPNNSDRMREVHTMIFFADGNRRSERGQHYVVDRPGIQPYERIDSGVTPIAWPRIGMPDAPVPMRDLAPAARNSGAFPFATEQSLSELS